MSKKVIWSQRVNQEDKDFLSHTLDQYRTEKGFESNREALVDIFNNLFRNETDSPHVLIPDKVISSTERGLESICEFGFLRKLELERKGARWYCLKQQGPQSAGRPMDLGNDPDSIRKICEACHTSWSISKQKDLWGRRETAILTLGESRISFTFYACQLINPMTSGPQVQIGEKNKFLCKSRGKMVTIQNTCMKDDCQFLFSHVLNVPIARSEAFKEFRKALEGPR